MSAATTTTAKTARSKPPIQVKRVFDPAKHCGARRRSDDIKGTGRRGDPCRNAKGAETDHLGSGPCKLHGGNTPAGKAAAANERAAKLLAHAGVQAVPIDSQRALMETVHLANGRVHGIRAEISDALEADVVDKPLIHSLLERYDSAIDRLSRTAKVTVDADIAERQQKLEEADGAKIRDLLLGAIDHYERQLPKPSIGGRKSAIEYLIAQMRQIDSASPLTRSSSGLN